MTNSFWMVWLKSSEKALAFLHSVLVRYRLRSLRHRHANLLCCLFAAVAGSIAAGRITSVACDLLYKALVQHDDYIFIAKFDTLLTLQLFVFYNLRFSF